MQTFEVENYARFTLNDAQLICKEGWKYLRKLNLVNSKIGSDAVLFFSGTRLMWDSLNFFLYIIFSENLPRLQSLLVLWQQPDDDYLTEIVELQVCTCHSNSKTLYCVKVKKKLIFVFRN